MRMKHTCLALLSLAPLLLGATYYVHPSASSDGEGTSKKPWTAPHACQSVQPGDEIVFMDGVYSDPIVCDHISGTEEHPITLRAEHSGKAIISTARSVGGWTPLENHLWISDSVEDLKASGVALWRVGDFQAHVWHDVKALNKDGVFSYRTPKSQFVIYSKDDPSDFEWKTWDNRHTGMVIQGVDWYILKGLVFQYNNVGLLVGCSRCGRATQQILIKDTTSEYATHWAMASTSGPNELTRHVTFDNVTLRYAAGSSPDHKTHNEYCFKFAASVNAADGQFGRVINSKIHHCNGHGIQASNGWDQIVLENNTCHDVSLKRSGMGACMRCGTTAGCTIKNNTIYGGDKPQGSGIYLQDGAHDILVENNEISGFDWHGIYIFSTNGKSVYNAAIRDNQILDNRITGIRIEAASGKEEGIEIASNELMDNLNAITLTPKRGASVVGVRLMDNICNDVAWQCLKADKGIDFLSARNSWDAGNE